MSRPRNPYTLIRQNWLLSYFWLKHPRGLSALSRVPCDAPAGVSMSNIRGLERRGLVKESDSAGSVFYLTDRGVQACQELFGVPISLAPTLPVSATRVHKKAVSKPAFCRICGNRMNKRVPAILRVCAKCKRSYR